MLQNSVTQLRFRGIHSEPVLSRKFLETDQHVDYKPIADLNDFPLSSSALRYSVRVTNTGTVGGGVNLLGFVTASDTAPPPAGFPLQRLFGFTGVDFLEPV